MRRSNGVEAQLPQGVLFTTLARPQLSHRSVFLQPSPVLVFQAWGTECEPAPKSNWKVATWLEPIPGRVPGWIPPFNPAPCSKELFKTREHLLFDGIYATDITYQRTGEAAPAAIAAGSKLYLQVRYFRYFSFTPGGKVLFLRSSCQPHQVVNLFARLRGLEPNRDEEKMEQITKAEIGSNHLEPSLIVHSGRWKTKKDTLRGDAVAVRIKQGSSGDNFYRLRFAQTNQFGETCKPNQCLVLEAHVLNGNKLDANYWASFTRFSPQYLRTHHAE